MSGVPKSLRYWFVAHFVIDMIFAIPLMVAPVWTLTLLQFEASSTTDLLLARLVAAALVGIGGISLLAHGAGYESFKNLLNLKLLWSGAAMIALLLAIYQGAPKTTWAIFGIFLAFFLVWGLYRRVF